MAEAYSYVVCDAGNYVATLEVKLFGRLRSVLAIFNAEEDALAVAFEVENISGIRHFVHKIEPELTISAPHGSAHNG